MIRSFSLRLILFFLGTLALTAVAIALGTMLNIEKLAYESKKAEITRVLELTVLNIRHQYDGLVEFKLMELNHRRQILKKNVQTIEALLDSHDRLFQEGLPTPDQARLLGLDHITGFLKQDEYESFIFNLDLKGVIHPDPSLMGKDWSGPRDIRGQDALIDARDTVIEKGERYNVIRWPLTQGGEGAKSLVYFKYYPPLQWVIGSAVPIGDIEESVEKAKKEILNRLEASFSHSLGDHEEFMFIFSKDRQVLLHPNLPGAEPDRMTHGLPLDRFMAASATPGQSVSFTWPPEAPKKTRKNKVAFIQHFKALDWYVGYALPKEMLEKPGRSLIGRHLVLILGIFVLSALVVLGLVRRLTRPVVRLTRHADQLRHMKFKSTRESEENLRALVGPGQDEIGRLAGAFLDMQLELKEFLGRLINTNLQLEQEIKDRELAQQEVWESRMHLKSLMDNAVGFVVFRLARAKGKNQSYHVVFVSPSINDILGVPPETPFKRWFSIVHPMDRPVLERAVDRLPETGRVNLTFRLGQGPKNEPRWAQIIAQGMEGQDVIYANGLLVDITPMKRLEQTLRDHQERLRKMGAELILAEERERRRIALGLHEDIGQTLALTKMKIRHLLKEAAHSRQETMLRETCDLVEELIRKIRSLTMEISPPVLYELGLDPAMEWLAERFQDHFGLEIDYAGLPGSGDLPEELLIFIFVAVRELLTNIVKHAEAPRASIVLRKKQGQIWLTIEDSGKGFDPDLAVSDQNQVQGFGLFSIRERLITLGGKMDIESAPGQGTRIFITVPLPNPSASQT